MKKSTSVITLIFIIAIGITLRFLLSRLGYNYDFESWTIVGKICANGGNVYAETTRYNYGPIFSLILKFCYNASQGNIEIFRYYIISILTCTDILIFLFLYTKYNLKIGLLYFLNPIIIILTGYHNQFENIALTLGILSILILTSKNRFHIITGSIILGISLSTKHILIFFPIWLLFSNMFSITNRILICGISIGIFAMSFIPYLPEGFTGIIQNVFKYNSVHNYPLIMDKYVSGRLSFIRPFYKYIFILFMLIIGFFVRKKPIKTLFFMYCIAIVCFSSSIVNQYLIIPLSAVCITKGKSKYLYFILCTGILLLHRDELHLFEQIPEAHKHIKHFFYMFIQNSYIIIAGILAWILFSKFIFKEKILHGK